MITFPFSYDIVESDDSTETMVVRYSAEGMETLDVSMPYPHSDVSLDEHLIMHAPEYHWVVAKKVRVKMQKGLKGTVTPVVAAPVVASDTPPPELTPQDISNLVDQLKKA